MFSTCLSIAVRKIHKEVSSRTLEQLKQRLNIKQLVQLINELTNEWTITYKIKC